MSNPPNQKAQDEVEGQSAATPLPGSLKDVWALVPDIEVGPFKVRQFVDGDFIRLAAFDHKLNSFTAVVASKRSEDGRELIS